jgi:sarcosine/dimethylglycine N-methyltransferase
VTTYTERDVADFFDQTTATYLSFWDSEGVLHTGYFASDTDEDYRAAAERTSAVLAGHAGIGGSSRVLDVGCGCGNFLVYLAGRFGCGGEGLDLSAERIKVAQDKLAAGGPPGIAFRHGSATAMPYPDGAFSHVVSQDALFLVPDKPRSHAEIHRVLAPGGIFACSDFLQPRERISEQARRHVYDRVRWSSGYSLIGYQQALAAAGFEIVLAHNLSGHLGQTYRVLGRAARERAAVTADDAARDWMLAFAVSCEEIQTAIAHEEFGWGVFVARKRGGATL